MPLEEFNHFFNESATIDVLKDINYIKQNFDIVKQFCEAKSLGDAFNSFDMNLYKQGETTQNKNILKAMTNIIIAMKDANDYNTYIKIRKEFERIFVSIYPDISKQIFAIKKITNNSVCLVFLDREGKKISFKNSDRLFHTSPKTGLSELKPVFKSERDGLLYPFNRIYFCLNFPIRPSGSFWDKTQPVYEYIPSTGNIVLFRDEEFYNNKGACFLKTDTPLPVRDVTKEIMDNYDIMYDKYKKAGR